MRVGIAIAAVALAVGLPFSQGDDKPSWLEATGSGDGFTFTLVPVGEPKAKRPDAKTTWTGLLAGMSKDANTQKLLKKLLNCEMPDLAALPKAPDEEFRPAAPQGKSQVYIGVYLSEGKPGQAGLAGTLRGTGSVVIFDVPPTRKWLTDATPFDAFLIAANEHLHRTKSGYHLHLGSGLSAPADLDAVDKRILDATKRGHYLADEIKEFLDKYKK